MNKINIKPVVVGLNITANAVAIQVLTLDITPEVFNLNARFFNVNQKEGLGPEVANIPFTLPLEDYENWQTNEYLENKSLAALNLEKV